MAKVEERERLELEMTKVWIKVLVKNGQRKSQAVINVELARFCNGESNNSEAVHGTTYNAKTFSFQSAKGSNPKCYPFHFSRDAA